MCSQKAQLRSCFIKKSNRKSHLDVLQWFFNSIAGINDVLLHHMYQPFSTTIIQFKIMYAYLLFPQFFLCLFLQPRLLWAVIITKITRIQFFLMWLCTITVVVVVVIARDMENCVGLATWMLIEIFMKKKIFVQCDFYIACCVHSTYIDLIHLSSFSPILLYNFFYPHSECTRLLAYLYTYIMECVDCVTNL